MEKRSLPSWWVNAKPFVNGGLAGCIGLTVMHPVDMVKVRIQLGQGSALQIVKTVLKEGGVMTFYGGWTAQMARQLSYGTIRLGSFQWLRDAISARDSNGKVLPLPFYLKMCVGLAAGTAGAIGGNPAEVALIRMQADKMLAVEERRNYRNVVQAIFRIVREESLFTLWRGCAPTVLRAGTLNASSLAVYDQTKEYVDTQMGTNSGTIAVCSGATTSGIVAAATSMPFDFVKTQVQQMRPNADGTMPYKGMQDCALQTLRRHGPAKFYVGFPVYCFRICPAVALILMVLEAVIDVERRLGI